MIYYIVCYNGEYIIRLREMKTRGEMEIYIYALWDGVRIARIFNIYKWDWNSRNTIIGDCGLDKNWNWNMPE